MSNIIINRDLLSHIIDTESRKMKEHNDCTVRATVHVCDVDYKVAHAALAKFGRKNRRGCYRPTQRKAIQSLGYTYESITKPEGAKTFKSVVKAMKKAGRDTGSYLIYCRGHVAAMVDGKIYDWAKGTQRRIQQIVQVVPKGHVAPVVKPVAPVRRKSVRTKVGVIASILEILKEETQPVTKQYILGRLVSRFPERSETAMARTIACQLPGRMSREKGVDIRKDSNGRFFLVK